MKKLLLACLLLFPSLSYAQSRTLIDGLNTTFDYGTAGQIKPKIAITKSITVFSPTTADSNKIQWYWPGTTTLTRVACSTDSGTVTIQLDERAEATPNTAGTNSLTSSLVCDTDSQVTTSFSDATIAANVPHNLAISAVSGTPGVLRINISGTE